MLDEQMRTLPVRRLETASNETRQINNITVQNTLYTKLSSLLHEDASLKWAPARAQQVATLGCFGYLSQPVRIYDFSYT